ncbi:MAG: ATP synthase subunit I [Erysipelotrichaceae bacterium]|nr:ATP synthase subunit I [Erysipelotrichaceae bacterium]
MDKELYIVSGIIGLVASIICFFFNWRISTGILLGLMFSFLYFYLLTLSFKIDENGNMSKGGIIGWFLRILVLALPLLIACLLPNVFNLYATFGGIMAFRLVLMVYFFKRKEGI